MAQAEPCFALHSQCAVYREQFESELAHLRRQQEMLEQQLIKAQEQPLIPPAQVLLSPAPPVACHQRKGGHAVAPA